MNFSPETAIANFFESKKRKCLHILLNGGMYFLKAKFESFIFEKMEFKNKLPLIAKINHTLMKYIRKELELEYVPNKTQHVHIKRFCLKRLLAFILH